MARLRGPAPAPPARRRPRRQLPALSLIVAAHDEQEVIEAKVANALALDYPRERLEVIVACDGCSDETAERAREAGADLVLELPRGGKIRAQDAAVERARGELAGVLRRERLWEPDAARELVGAFARREVGYACGQVRFTAADGATNQEGVYWRYELAVRELESRLSSITAGNGAIYATRRDSYIVVDPIMGHDLSLPFNIVKRGLRAVYVPERAREREDGALARGRVRAQAPDDEPHLADPAARRHALAARLPARLRADDPLPPPAALRLPVPAPDRAGRATSRSWRSVAGTLYAVTLALQLALLAAAALAGALPLRPLLIARYYVLTTASCAAGLWDWLRHGTSASWEAAEGTR